IGPPGRFRQNAGYILRRAARRGGRAEREVSGGIVGKLGIGRDVVVPGRFDSLHLCDCAPGSVADMLIDVGGFRTVEEIVIEIGPWVRLVLVAQRDPKSPGTVVRKNVVRDNQPRGWLLERHRGAGYVHNGIVSKYSTERYAVPPEVDSIPRP